MRQHVQRLKVAVRKITDESFEEFGGAEELASDLDHSTSHFLLVHQSKHRDRFADIFEKWRSLRGEVFEFVPYFRELIHGERYDLFAERFKLYVVRGTHFESP